MQPVGTQDPNDKDDRDAVAPPFAGRTAAAPAAFATRSVAQDHKMLQVFIDGDPNISNWCNDTIKPAFEAAQPGLSFNVTITRGVSDGTGMPLLLLRRSAQVIVQEAARLCVMIWRPYFTVLLLARRFMTSKGIARGFGA